MNDSLWTKAAISAFSLLIVLAGWGLNKVYEVDQKVTRIEVKLDIWTTPTSHPQPHIDGALRRGGIMNAAMMPYKAAQAEQFTEKALVRACDLILQKNPEAALKTLLVALDGIGIACSPAGDHVECEKS